MVYKPQLLPYVLIYRKEGDYLVRIGIIILSGIIFWFYFFILSNATEDKIKEYNEKRREYSKNPNMNDINGNQNINYQNTQLSNQNYNENGQNMNNFMPNNDDKEGDLGIFDEFSSNNDNLNYDDFNMNDISYGFNIDDDNDDNQNLGSTF